MKETKEYIIHELCSVFFELLILYARYSFMFVAFCLSLFITLSFTDKNFLKVKSL